MRISRLSVIKRQAIQMGIHDLIDFDGIVMTDSGGYQVLEYGDIEIRARNYGKIPV